MLGKFFAPLLRCAIFVALAACTGTPPASEVGMPKVNKTLSADEQIAQNQAKRRAEQQALHQKASEGRPLTLTEKRALQRAIIPPPEDEQTKTVCFGRFMIDLPKSAQLVWGPMEVPYEMEVYPGEGPTIEAEIKAKVKEITSEEHDDEPSMLIGVFDSINPDSKIVVGYESSSDAVFVELHSYIRLGNTAFVQSIPSTGQGRDDGNGNWILDKTLYKKRVAYLLSIARRLRLRDEKEIPKEHGVCIEEGFLAVPLDDRSERIAIGFRFPELPDVTFAVETRNTDRPTEDDTLKAARRAGREAASDSGELALFNSIQTLRERNRAIGEWKGAEALLRLPSNRKRKVEESHEFVFISPGVGEDLLRPYARIMMYTGVKDNTRGRVPPSLTDDEAIALWDKLTSTIRVRPVN